MAQITPSEVRASGQSRLMEQTFAGKNACNPKNHDRPFVIEWDATDMSSFEARAKNDVISVKYEGCELRVLEGCSNDSVRGSFGSYKPVDWTGGSLEKVDIGNQAELVAKLPLGVASLGGRVQSGEKFHMEYFVSGTRNATREAVYRSDIKAVPACSEATHFVYGYNLGAFALGTASGVNAKLDASIYGFGASGAKTSSQQAEKQGGLLGSCRAASAKELDTCKVPIRLSLREIQESENPDASAAKAPETKSALNLAGKLQKESAKEKAAQEHLQAATKKMNVKDGKGCLHELDMHDRLDSRPGSLSTNNSIYVANTRAVCLMIAGQCETGMRIMRQYVEGLGNIEDPDAYVKTMASQYCQGAASEDVTLERAYQNLSKLARSKSPSVTECRSEFGTITRLAAKLSGDAREPWDQYKLNGAQSFLSDCLVRAGDCSGGWGNEVERNSKSPTGQVPGMETSLRANWDHRHKECRGK